MKDEENGKASLRRLRVLINGAEMALTLYFEFSHTRGAGHLTSSALATKSLIAAYGFESALGRRPRDKSKTRLL